MRVTGNSFNESLIRQLNALAARQYQLQNHVSSGQRIQAPEDDPGAMQRALGWRAENNRTAQYAANISALDNRAVAAFNALKSVKTVTDRAGEIVILADGLSSPDELQAYAREVTELIKQAVQTINSQHNDQYLFAGTRVDQPPFVMTTDANGNVTGVTYQGNTSIAENEIAKDSLLAVDVPGANTTGAGARGLVTDSRAGADLFNHLISLQNHLLAGDTAAIAAADQPALAQDEDNLIYHITNNAAVQTRLEAAASAADSLSLALEGALEKEVGADLTETLVQLSQAQTAYQAALQSASGILGMSLLDYL